MAESAVDLGGGLSSDSRAVTFKSTTPPTAGAGVGVAVAMSVGVDVGVDVGVGVGSTSAPIWIWLSRLPTEVLGCPQGLSPGSSKQMYFKWKGEPVMLLAPQSVPVSQPVPQPWGDPGGSAASAR